MNLIYEGVDITDSINITKAVHHDVSDRSDLLELELDAPQSWYDWRPEMGDTIRLTEGKYDTGTLYLNTVAPSERRYAIYATSTARAATRERYMSFENKTLKEIMDVCAAWCGMQSARFGIDDGISYPYLICDRLGATGFLSELLRREGCALKTINGRLTAISIEYAQSLSPSQTITLDSLTDRTRYEDYRFERISHLRVTSAFGNGEASDTNVEGGDGSEIISDLYPPDLPAATRWAKGLLLGRNRGCEKLEINMEYNDSLSAMVRVDIDGPTAATGEWLIDECVHDFINRTTKLKLLRCQAGIS